MSWRRDAIATLLMPKITVANWNDDWCKKEFEKICVITLRYDNISLSVKKNANNFLESLLGVISSNIGNSKRITLALVITKMVGFRTIEIN